MSTKNIKIFLSHSDKDKKIASELKSKLSKYELDVFLAHEDIDGGSDWVAKLYEEIQNSNIFIMLLTKNYHPSKYTDQETGIAINCKKTILPMCLDETRPYGFATSKQAIVCSFPFEDAIIEKIVKLSKIEDGSKSTELDRLLFELENSSSYAESAAISVKLKNHENFSESQLRRLAYASMNNPQVYYSYVADGIINQIIESYLDKVNPEFYEFLSRFVDPSHPSLSGDYRDSPRENEYNQKKLNNEIFRKLMRVMCIDDFRFFEGRVGFVIPLDREAFSNKLDSQYIHWIQTITKENLEKKIETIDKQIPNLQTGEKFLSQYYPQAYHSWIKIKDELSNLNKNRDSFLDLISNKILKEFQKYFKFAKNISKDFDTTPKLRLNPFGNGWAYFQDNMPKILPILLDSIIVKFDEDFNENQNYVHFGGYRIVGVNDEKIIKTSNCEVIVNSIIKDSKISDKWVEFKIQLQKLNQNASDFGNELEKSVVYDIDAKV